MVARNLIVFGLALIAAGLLVNLLSLAVQIAIPTGVLLIVIGVVWHLAKGGKRRR